MVRASKVPDGCQRLGHMERRIVEVGLRLQFKIRLVANPGQEVLMLSLEDGLFWCQRVSSVVMRRVSVFLFRNAKFPEVHGDEGGKRIFVLLHVQELIEEKA
ncbi:hypothetical protein Tco_0541098 [Tanacetum coccineum]